MGTAQVQGSLWGVRVADYVNFVEGAFQPLFERVFDETQVGPDTSLLDIGCGPGLALQLAAGRGAKVAGVDAAAASIAIARERTPDGDFRVGEMEDLPWGDATFDVVTGFHSFFYAANLPNALREARRVTRSGGRVAMSFWGLDEECETMATMAAIRALLPPPASSAATDLPLATAGRVESLFVQASLVPMISSDVIADLEFPNLEMTVRGLMSVGAAVAASRRLGEESVEGAIAASLAPFRTSHGGYRQRNRLRYVIAWAESGH